VKVGTKVMVVYRYFRSRIFLGLSFADKINIPAYAEARLVFGPTQVNDVFINVLLNDL